MKIGMLLIAVGVLLAAYGLLPHLAQVRMTTRGAEQPRVHIVGGVRLNREHWKLAVVLAVALTIDVMKPASIAFVMPGMALEYGLSMSTVGYIALAALIGTAIGSLTWGRVADIFGRRAAILLSAILFMGTAICGTMPSFRWNVVMCFVMGAAAGGMLPVAVTLMAEAVPARHRGWLLVALGGVSASAGFLAASGAAALLEPKFSWRVLWLLNLPTGALIVVLNRFLPESPRFLARAGLREQACGVLRRFAGSDTLMDVSCVHTETSGGQSRQIARCAVQRGQQTQITLAMLMCGLAWGLVNFGFVLWLPSSLQKFGFNTHAVSLLLAQSALLAMPGVALVVWLYQRWSSFKSLVSFMMLTVTALLAFAVMEVGDIRTQTMVVVAVTLLLLAIGGVIATLIPYSAEIYAVQSRGTGTGLVAAGSKAGGILGAMLGLAGLFDSFLWAALVIAVPMAIAGVLLWRSAVETSGYELEDIWRC
ncbi:MAG TPA: MFS transporter [Rhodanobacteraceae bacterium]